jgi:hypothetical protein
MLKEGDEYSECHEMPTREHCAWSLVLQLMRLLVWSQRCQLSAEFFESEQNCS